jgi:glycosyltransferase involved in cell wall biosynthesis
MQVVLCAGAPDTEEIGREMKERVDQARIDADDEIIWIDKMLPRPEVISIYTQASVFVCPSVYEPFGIINLEAMACETPVIASKVGGIPEIVVPGETGLLIPIETSGKNDFEPKDGEKFTRDIASAINRLMSNPDLLQKMGKASRKRVEDHFSWTRIAERTLNFYEELIAGQPGKAES